MSTNEPSGTNQLPDEKMPASSGLTVRHLRGSRLTVRTSERPRGVLGCMKEGLLDLKEGLQGWRIWHVIGSADIRRRYDRSRLGQVWLTLSTGIFVLMYGAVFTLLFRQPAKDMLPYVAVSFILWSMISAIIGNATTCLVGVHGYFQNQYASFSIAIFVVIYRELMTFAHEFLIIIAVLLYFGHLSEVRIFEAIFGLILVIFTLTWVAYAVAIICVRYRDMIQIIASILRAAFFVTPVFWRVDMFPVGYQHYLIFNPFNVLLTLVRDPLIGVATPPEYLIYGTASSLVGFFCVLILIGKYRRRIVFWV